ncbi:MAG: hypothetical protein ACE5HJ_06255 [Thermoplasmata archaeon]
MEDMIKMIAEAPEEERKKMMKDRLQMFISMPEDKRVESISQLVTAFSKLKPKQREELIKGRTMLVASFSDKDRFTLMASRMKAGMKLPKDVHQSDMQLTEQSVPQLPAELKQNFMKTMEAVKKELMPQMAKTAAPSAGPPTHHDKPMVLRGVFSKKYVCTVCGHKVSAR